jgi:glutamate racemase
VVAYAERLVRTRGLSEPVRLTFANAAPANDRGYNSMASHGEKLAAFDHFLRKMVERFAPDSIYVACNTLSVLLPQVPYFANTPVPMNGIVETSAGLTLRALEADPRSVAMIFATQTTTDMETYPRLLAERGVDPSRIISQACPGLADTISEDRDGTRTREEIGGWVSAALRTMQDGEMKRAGAPVVACLACTHYGYRKDFFAAVFEEAAVDAVVVNPNESAVHDIVGLQGEGACHEAEVEFVTRYRIPDATIETLTYFLSDVSPRAVAALQAFEYLPDLF